MNHLKPSLVILAAGMASRYGSAKQTESFGPAGETIMEYSIFDAIKAGFDQVVFIIREEFAEAFKAVMEPKLRGKVKTRYVYQSLDKFRNGRPVPEGRVKPYGTQHALLCCKDVLDAPFAVINADDFYGLDAFKKAYKFLSEAIQDGKYACLGYQLKNTLSEHGAVTRGEIRVDGEGFVEGITERKEIFKREDKAFRVSEEHEVEMDLLTPVSMNFFCFTPAFVEWSEGAYYNFLDEQDGNLKSEFLIPEVVDQLINTGKGTVSLVKTDARWFGVTFKEDAEIVRAELEQLTSKGDYPKSLWA
ncbi:nucleotidyltransferase family protein [Pedobacter terrae]|uniref:nucleotidyltransferase family protein n=1 Tax=Pedobacter terrae TaxID=405671 RepID=UPI002FFA4448